MSTGRTAGAAPRAVVVSKALVQARANALVRRGGGARVLVLRALPEWEHGDLEADGRTIRVLAGVSQLAILDAYESLPQDQNLIVLTDRPTEDLGDVVFARALTHDILMPDEWAAIPGLFPGAKEVSLDLRRYEWAASALLDHEPPGGWPAASGKIAVSAEHALSALLARLVRLDPGTPLDEVLLLMTLGSKESRASWAAVDGKIRKGLTRWAQTELGTAAAFALRVAAASELVAPAAVALAVDVLWPEEDGAAAQEQVAARARVEKYLGGYALSAAEARAVVQVAHTAVLRLSLDDHRAARDLPVLLEMAQALLGDLRWPAGAERSTVLPAGYAARARHLAAALEGTASAPVEAALADLLAHRDAENGRAEAPRMAVRLHRWLATKEVATDSLGADLRRQMDDGAWVDAALGVVWSASDDPEVRDAYRRLIENVRTRRRARDELAARRLDETDVELALGAGLTGAVPVERLLRAVVAPWRATNRVLLVVLDGMSAAIAADLADEVTRYRLAEWVPTTSRRRVPALAALPSSTGVSRTSLFTGQVRSGDGAVEKAGLAKSFPGSVLFHKGDLRAEGGARLPEPVITAMGNTKVPVVGVVINAIDDATHKNDTSAESWTIARLAPLAALLELAALHGRAVVLTSDHGHVVERATVNAPPTGAESRWRPMANGTAVGPGEVMVSGRRVVAGDDGEAGDQAILLWRDDLRHGRVQAGYHGGASLAEITIPALVFQGVSRTDGPEGWSMAPPQVPVWWNDPVTEPSQPKSAVKPKSRATRKRVTGDAVHANGLGQDALFEVAPDAIHIPPARAGEDLATAVLSSPVYVEERRIAGKAAADDAIVGAMLRALLERDGRAHRDTLAAAVGIAAAEIAGVLAAVRRVLNVDGYAVLATDDGGETVRLDELLLRDQFEV
ncbi:BREX-2 system phosphatase PglZ [Promicromonospora sp. NPDC057138]|uniref:BREX-2 system phosphatase PglZ n=1 Tax=Promicromonospora sp. NPDC057138 TaxID=3346031 RepID=UPI003625FC06